MDRFENARDATLAKYRMMQRPQGKLSDGLNLAVDGIATLCMGEPQLLAQTQVVLSLCACMGRGLAYLRAYNVRHTRRATAETCSIPHTQTAGPAQARVQCVSTRAAESPAANPCGFVPLCRSH